MVCRVSVPARGAKQKGMSVALPAPSVRRFCPRKGREAKAALTDYYEKVISFCPRKGREAKAKGDGL